MKARALVGGIIAIALCSQLAAQGLIKSGEGLFETKSVKNTVAMAKGQRLVINAASTLAGQIALTTGGSACTYSYKKLLKTPTKVEAAEY